MTKRKAPAQKAPARKGKRPRTTIAQLETQNQKLNEHLNMCVRRINLLADCVHFLQNKIRERTRLYNKEFGSLHSRCDKLVCTHQKNFCNLDGYGESATWQLPMDDMAANGASGDCLMSEKELIDAIASF